MKKDLNIMEQGDKPIFKVGRFDGNLNFTESPSEFRQLGENEGRVGYCQAAKEEKKEPAFTIGKYEDIMKDWANHSDNIGTLGENEGRIGLFQEVRDMKKEPIIVSEYESNHKPVRLPC